MPIGTQVAVAVAKPPPAPGQAKHQVHKTESPVSSSSDQDHRSAGGQELTDVGQGLAHLRRGVDDLSGQDQVKGLVRQPLLGGRLLDVKQLVADEGIRLELLPGLGEEVRRDVSENVFRPIRPGARVTGAAEMGRPCLPRSQGCAGDAPVANRRPAR